jgi:hypothetical protein
MQKVAKMGRLLTRASLSMKTDAKKSGKKKFILAAKVNKFKILGNPQKQRLLQHLQHVDTLHPKHKSGTPGMADLP